MFSRGEWLILAGFCLCVVSAALKWGTNAPPVHSADPAVVLFQQELTVEASGYDKRLGWLKAGWGVVVLALVAGCLLLAEPTPRNRVSLLAAHLAMSLGIVALVVLCASLYPGVLLAAVGSLLLIAGGFVRYRPILEKRP
jgi:hypothetical protein